MIGLNFSAIFKCIIAVKSVISDQQCNANESREIEKNPIINKHVPMLRSLDCFCEILHFVFKFNKDFKF